MTRLSRALIVSAAICLAALTVLAPVATAHPLGNFTINHYNGLRVSPDTIVIDHVTDFAEIPTFAERRAMDANSDGMTSADELAAYRLSRCAELRGALGLSVAGQPVDLSLTHAGASFAMGQGSDTLRLVCVYSADLDEPLASGIEVHFEDSSYQARRGWREIVVVGDGATITSDNLLTTSSSERLTRYPTDLLALPLDQSDVSFEVDAGGPALPPAAYPDAQPLNASPAAPEPTPDSVVHVVPNGATDLGQEVTALFQAPELTPPVIVLSLLVALLLGAFHALSPGHGKTVMAAYLVGSNGSMRQAVGLGMTVTLSHTLGVLALGALSVSAAAFLPPERLYPILSVVSGAIVIVIGAYLLLTRVNAARRARAQRPDHAHAHDSPHDHHHDHDHAAPPARPPGWHEHDGIGHSHLPQPGMGRRGLFALGLSGGMVPSVSALLVLLGSISIGRPAYGIVLTVAFGAGMAIVLVGIGLTLVHARKFVERLKVRSPFALGQRLPIVTALVVLVAGFVIAGQGLVGIY